MSKRAPFHALAVQLYDGDPQSPPRYREGIIASIEAALEAAYAKGKADGAGETRERALRDMLSIARGLQQDANARANALEIELRDLLDRLGKVAAT